MMEIYARGPVTAGLAGSFLKDYQGGIISDRYLKDISPTHEVSIIGWGTEQNREKYWIIRNSWGEYWGEMSFARYVVRICLQFSISSSHEIYFLIFQSNHYQELG